MYNHTAGMTLEEQIGQVLAAGFHSTTPSQDIIDLIQNHHVGNIILFKRNIQSAQQVLELTHSLQRIAKEAGHRHPLLIMIDQENGMVRRLGQATTLFPGNMALGAIGSETIAYDIALAAGRELQALGINMNLAPVVDVNNNPANPVIGVRSFGEDPCCVARLGTAMVQGYRAAGVITTLKHFPGHGDTTTDSHLALPVIPYTMERLEAVELAPFKSAIKAGADSVMIAHLYLPYLMRGNMLPSTVSHTVVTELLRKKLDFEGLIISDCMEMQALVDTVGTEQGAVKALQAGIDLVLVSHCHSRQRGSIKAIQAAVEDGTLSADKICQAAERILQLKARFLSWDNLPGAAALALIGNEAHQQLRDCAYELSTTLVRNAEGLLPLCLQPEQRLLLLFLRPTTSTAAIDERFAAEALVENIRKRHKQVDALFSAPQSIANEYEAIYQAVNNVAVTLVVTANANLDAYQGQLVRQLLQTGRPIIGIAAHNPYDLLAFPELGTYLVTYECTEPAFAAAARVLFGEIRARGTFTREPPWTLPARFQLR
jgi:beta-N-acetylhexosaminidase